MGVGLLKKQQVVFPLAPVYQRAGVDFRQARAVALWPEGDAESPTPAVEVEWTRPDRRGQREKIRYDFQINATGPKLNFEAAPGLGPG